MKTKLSVLLALAAAIGSPGVIAQEPSTPQAQAPFSGPTPAPSTPPSDAPPQQATPPPPATPPETTPAPKPPPPPPSDQRKDDEQRRQRERHEDMGRARDRDHERGRDRDRDRDRLRDHDMRGPRDAHREPIGQPRPFLGVMTAPVPPAISAQLGLPEGFGLLVQEVLPDSPAAKAGIQKYDVLRYFNDQQLVDPNQLATFVRAAGKDASVTLTVIRKGQEQKLTAAIAERVMPERRRLHGAMGDVPQLDPRGGPEEIRRFHERIRKFHERARENQERAREQHEHHQSQQSSDRKDPANVPSANILRDVRIGGGGPITIVRADGQTVLDGSKARFVLKDDEGEIEVSAENGKRMLTAKSPKGEVVFSGPVNTDEERKAVPEQFRKKLDRIEVRQSFDANTGRAEAFAGNIPGAQAFPGEEEFQ